MSLASASPSRTPASKRLGHEVREARIDAQLDMDVGIVGSIFAEFRHSTVVAACLNERS